MAKINLYVASTTATLTAALFGYSVGLIGGLIILPSFLSHFKLSELSHTDLAAEQSKIVTLWLVGAALGVPVGIPLCSRFGRKVCLAVAAALYVLGAALQLVGGLTMFEIGRTINGLGVGAGTLVGPMYISEVSPPSERGMLMSGYQTLLQLCALGGFWGAFATHSIFSDTSNFQWQVPVIIQLIPGSLLLIGSLFIPETPQFLASQEKWKAASESLAWLRQLSQDDHEFTEEFHEIKIAAELNKAMQNRQQVSFVQEAMKKPIRKRLGVGIGLMIAQNMVGLNALNYYAPVIFMSAGFTSVSSSLFLTGLFGIVKLVSATAFMFVFVRMRGNRFWLKFGCIVCGVSMMILAYFVRSLTSGSGADKSAGLTFGGAVSVLMVYVFAFAFGVSLGPISWNVCSESQPVHSGYFRYGYVLEFGNTYQSILQIVIAGITPRLIASVGWVTYLIYAIFCLITYVWVIFYVPETRGVALGKPMDSLFDDESKASLIEGPEIEEVGEEEISVRTALLHRERERQRRRSSFAGYNT